MARSRVGNTVVFGQITMTGVDESADVFGTNLQSLASVQPGAAAQGHDRPDCVAGIAGQDRRSDRRGAS